MGRLFYLFHVFSCYLLYAFQYKKFGFKSIVLYPVTSIKGKRRILIGRGCFIHKFARIEAVEKYCTENFQPNLTIEDSVFIQQNFHCTCAKKIRIGKGTSITPNVGVFDIIHPYQNITVNPREQNIEVREVDIGENCLLGMNSVILPGTILGKHCIVGANSVVSGVFADYSVIVGSPAKVVKKYDEVTNEWIKIL